MFGMGMGEIILIAVVALLVLGPERLPGAAKAIGKGIRDLRAQTRDLQQTIEQDTQIGDAVREIRTALRGDPETLYKAATGEDFHDKPALAGKQDQAGTETKDAKNAETKDAKNAETKDAKNAETKDAKNAGEAGPSEHDETVKALDASETNPPKLEAVVDAFANIDDEWGQAPSNPHENGEAKADPDMPVIRTPAGAMARGDESEDDDSSHG